MKLPAAFRIHPAFRPILLGVMAFVIANTILTLGVTFSPLNQRFNFSYGNFLPAKLAMLRQADPQRMDILFLGTSQTNNGFIPAVFEKQFPKAGGRPINSFNLGLPNNRYDVMQAYLQMHVRKFGKPRLVLVELGTSIQEKDSYFYYLPALYYRTLIENEPVLAVSYLANPLVAWNVKQELLLSSLSSLRQFRFSFSPVNMLSKVSGKLKDISDRLHPAVASASSDHVVTGNDTQPQEEEIDPKYLEKGWYPKPQSPHMITASGVAESVREARKYYIDPQREVRFDKLRTLLAYCRKEKIAVVLVTWPNHPAFLKELNGSHLAKPYSSGLTALQAETGVPMLDLNRSLPSSQKETEGGLFADPRHLTPQGAELFSGKLAHEISTLPDVKDALLSQR